ncbi:alkaline phosphatase D family protein, partial [Coraliomargarita sp. SDUM461004]
MNHYHSLPRREFLALAATAIGGTLVGYGSQITAPPRIVSLKDAHIGTLEIDLRIMNQYMKQPRVVQDFYTACRVAMTGNSPEQAVAQVCRQFNRRKIGGPLLGDLSASSVAVWMHLPEPDVVKVLLTAVDSDTSTTFIASEAARVHSVRCEGLSPDTAYRYQVIASDGVRLGEGRFVTAPTERLKQPFRMAFGTCFHKVGMYRPELMQLIQERGNRAMWILGDSAVDGRKDDLQMINVDYLLRDLSAPWQQLSANVPITATWDDHDYWGNDTSGAFNNQKKPIDVAGLLQSWRMQWNNPQRDVEREGIYFQTKIGPVHYIALDTRSCRVNAQRGQLHSFLGETQTQWLKQQLAESTSPCIVISGGTMWSDYISDGKDSWGTWDIEGREEIFQWIDAKSDSLVLLLSGDRHGARGFEIPRPNGKKIYELEVATMGGVPGPGAFGKNTEDQLFGLESRSWAFGELTFSPDGQGLKTVFRL